MGKPNTRSTTTDGSDSRRRSLGFTQIRESARACELSLNRLLWSHGDDRALVDAVEAARVLVFALAELAERSPGLAEDPVLESA